tara:strand:+ start:2343 stop:3557 length:1215 start_codon:yes stop_codon:yes gene_type:complete
LKNKKKIIIYNNNPINLEEYFFLLIKILESKFEILFIQLNFSISSLHINKLSNYEKKYKNFKVLYLDKQKTIKDFKYHLKLKNFFNKISFSEYSAVIYTSEFYVIDKYLLFFANKSSIKKILVCPNVLSPNIIDIYDQKKNIYKLTKKNKLLNYVKFNLRNFLIDINYILLPLLTIGKFFQSTPSRNFSFELIESDHVVCHDTIEMKTLKYIFPNKKGIIHCCEHPLKNKKILSKNNNKMLLIMGGYVNECDFSQINFIFLASEYIYKKFDIEEIDIRFHPRTNFKLRWISEFENLLKKNGLKYNFLALLDQKPISSVSKSYKFYLGPLSSAIKLLGYTSNSKIIGLLNTYDKFTKSEKKIHFGDSFNVNLVRNLSELKTLVFKKKSNFELNKQNFEETILKLI